jgi:heat shock protein HslJ
MPVRTIARPLVLIGLVALAACGGAGPVGEEPDLAGRTFVATQVAGHEQVPGTEIRLSFEDGTVGAHAGCNSMSGPATWDDGVLVVPADGLAQTLIGCPDDLAAQDEWLVGLLTSRPAIALSDDGVLTVGDDSSGLTMQERADAALVGSDWVLDGLVTADAVSSVPTGARDPGLRLEEAEEGMRLAVRTGCNSGSGSVTVLADDDPASGTLEVGPLATTRMACDEAATSVETHVLAVLDGTVTYAVEGDSLTLTNGDLGLILRLR